MAASSCRRPRLRYSMTLASPCIVRIPDPIGRDRRPSIENVAKCAGATRGESPPAGGKRRLSKADLVALPSARAAAAGRRAHVVVAEHVARTDDHGRSAFPGGLVRYATIDT